MIFHRARHKNHRINNIINKVHTEQGKHTQFLCVIFDDNLDWSNHLSYMNIKIAKGIGIICRAKMYFNTSVLINLYIIYILLVYSPFSDRVGLPLHNIHIPSPFTSVMDILYNTFVFPYVVVCHDQVRR